MRYLLTFYAVEGEWMALSSAEREAGIAEIGRWFAEHAHSGKIIEGRAARPWHNDRPARTRAQEGPADGQ